MNHKRNQIVFVLEELQLSVRFVAGIFLVFHIENQSKQEVVAGVVEAQMDKECDCNYIDEQQDMADGMQLQGVAAYEYPDSTLSNDLDKRALGTMKLSVYDHAED
jgi:hypothetical protein